MDLSQFSQNQEIDIDAERLIASGGTSLCYRVKLYGKQHFLKRLKPEFRSNPRYVAAIRKEFETGYNLDHRHLVRYVACGDDYILTEWIDGVTLKEFAEKNPTFFNYRDNVRRLLGELLDVVEYLHSHQIVHLDLKPDNILITRVGNELKLTDLGFCYTDTYTDTMGQTSSFAAPEQLDGGGHVDERTDIYAIGKILGTLPCASSYNQIIERCTKTTAEDRYQSIDELRQNLNGHRGKWKWTAFILALLCLIGFAFWVLSPFTNETVELKTTDTTSVYSNNNDTVPPTVSDNNSMTQSNPGDIPSTTHAPSIPKPMPPSAYAPSAVSAPSSSSAAPTQGVPVNKGALRSELEGIARASYNKYLKQFEDKKGIDYLDNELRENRTKYLDEVADKFFYMWSTKYKDRISEYEYNHLAVEVMHSYINRLDERLFPNGL